MRILKEYVINFNLFSWHEWNFQVRYVSLKYYDEI